MKRLFFANKKMKIAFLHKSLIFGGAERLILDIVLALAS